jgi:hypothetical protein
MVSNRILVNFRRPQKNGKKFSPAPDRLKRLGREKIFSPGWGLAMSLPAASIAPIQEARGEGVLVTGPPNARFPAHIAERFMFIGICQLLGVVCKGSQFQTQFTLCQETNNDRFFATAGRAAKKLGQSQKLSQRELRQFKFIPTL